MMGKMVTDKGIT